MGKEPRTEGAGFRGSLSTNGVDKEPRSSRPPGGLGFCPVGLVHTSSQRKGLGFAAALAVAALLATLALSLGASSAAAAGCPSFRVLHDDRIGPAGPAGRRLHGHGRPVLGPHLPRRLETLHPLPRGLRRRPPVAPGESTPRAAARPPSPRAVEAGFSVALGSKAAVADGGNSELGALCQEQPSRSTPTSCSARSPSRGASTCSTSRPRSGISCNRAAVLFTRFLGSPGGRLPFPWRLQNQTATFFKPAHPTRSAFRVEPAAGAGASCRRQ